ncbi:MAG: AsmA-like C-terminal region-containing protein [Bacteroidota bacterium]
MRIIKSIISGLFFAVFIIVVIALSISFIYEDEVSKIFLKEVNKRIETDIQTGDVNLSLLKKFPNASLVIDDVQLSTRDANSDTSLLITVENLFLQFDIIDIFLKNYSINRVHAKNCDIKYNAGKKPEVNIEEKSSGNFKMDINHLKITDLNYIIENNSKGFKLEGYSPQAILKGNLASKAFSVDIEAETEVESLVANDFRYLYRKTISIDSDVFVSPDKYEVEEGYFRIEGMPVGVNGKLNRKNQHIDLTCQGKNLSISKLKINVPWDVQQKMKDFTISSGRVDILASVEGKVKDQQPEIETDLKIRNGKFRFKNFDESELSDVSASIYYTNGIFKKPRSSFLKLSNIKAGYKKSALKGNFSIKNFKSPRLEANLNLNIGLNDMEWISDSLNINDQDGYISSQLHLNSSFKKLKNIEALISQKKLTADLNFNDVSFNTKDFQVQSLNGFAYIDRSFYCNTVDFTLNGSSDFKFSGRIDNFYSPSDDSPLAVKGKIQSENLRLDELIKKRDSGQKSFNILDKLTSDINVSVENFYHKKHHIRNIKGNIKLHPDFIQFGSLSFNTLGGSGRINGKLSEAPEDNFQIDGRFYLNKVDIKKGFEVFNNFGQDYIQSQNIGGDLTGEFYLSTLTDSTLKVYPESIENVSDFKIHNGELTQFEPLQELSRFISVSELKDVQFSEFSNRITIEDEKINIPKMDIHSSALGLTISGYHNFDGSYSYNMNLLLSEILSRKAKKSVNEHGIIEDDGVGNTRLYLLMEGDSTESTIKYDKKGVKEKIRQDIKDEKDNLKQIFNEEFGFFKKDSAFNEKDSDKIRNDEFDIRWEDSDAEKKEEKELKPKKDIQDSTKFKIEWDKDTLK